MKTFNSSRLPWEEATAPKGAAAHSLGTTALLQLWISVYIVQFEFGYFLRIWSLILYWISQLYFLHIRLRPRYHIGWRTPVARRLSHNCYQTHQLRSVAFNLSSAATTLVALVHPFWHNYTIPMPALTILYALQHIFLAKYPHSVTEQVTCWKSCLAPVRQRI